VQVGDHHVSGPCSVRGTGDRFADPRSGSGDDDDSIT
jgi:hypothetical protein